MKLVPQMDAGPIYAQEKIALSGKETKQELADKLSELGSQMVIDNLPAILDVSLSPTPQDDSQATTDRRVSKAYAELDFNKSATQLEREVRAFAGWPRSRAKLGSTEVIITKAHVQEGSGQPGELKFENKTLGIYTKDGVLVIDSLVPAGKAEMSTEAFLAGYKLN
jgi:methionyl-tRNA formyltransferase